MKKLYLLLLASLSMFFISCSNMEIGFEKESIFYGGGSVYIYLDKGMQSDEKYRVYINGEDSEVSLALGYKTRFGIKSGATEIGIVHGTQRTDINLNLEASKNYYLRVQKSENGKIEILEIVKTAISSDVKSTPIYVDENEEKIATQNEKKVISQNENKTTFQHENKEKIVMPSEQKTIPQTSDVEKSTEVKNEPQMIKEKKVQNTEEGETTFYYDPLEGD